MSTTTAPSTSPEISRTYARDGFVVLRDLLPPAEVLDLRAHAERLIANDAVDGQVRYLQQVYDRQGRLKHVKGSGFADHDPRFNALATMEPLVDVVEMLVGRGARRFRDVLIVKPGRTGGSFSYHQDSAYWDVEPKSLVSCWVALGDVSAQGSCLRVVPGTHRSVVEHQLYVRGRYRVPPVVTRSLRRLVSLAGTGDNPEGTGGVLAAWQAKRWLLASATRFAPVLSDLHDFRIPPAAVRPEQDVLLPVHAGDVIFFHSLLWHASGPNETDTARFAEIISFMGPDARYVGRGGGHFPLARGQ